MQDCDAEPEERPGCKTARPAALTKREPHASAYAADHHDEGKRGEDGLEARRHAGSEGEQGDHVRRPCGAARGDDAGGTHWRRVNPSDRTACEAIADEA